MFPSDHPLLAAAAVAQGPNIGDPEARAILNVIGPATSAADLLVTALREGFKPDVAQVALYLADALNVLLKQYPAADEHVVSLRYELEEFLAEEAV